MAEDVHTEALRMAQRLMIAWALLQIIEPVTGYELGRVLPTKKRDSCSTGRAPASSRRTVAGLVVQGFGRILRFVGLDGRAGASF